MSEFHSSISIAGGPPYSIIILSPAVIVCGVVRVKVYSTNVVPRVCEFIISLKLATIASSDLLLTFAVTFPEGVPRFRNLTLESMTNIGDDKNSNNNSVKKDNNIPPTTYDQTMVIEQNNKIKISLKATANDHDRIIFSIVKEPLYGKLISFNPSSGKVTYVPNNGFSGHDKFIFKATDPT